MLGLPFEDVHPFWGDTDGTLFEIGSCASRTMYIDGNAVKKAAAEAREKLLKRAAAKLGLPSDRLDIKHKQVFVKDNPGIEISASEVIREAIYNKDNVEQIVGVCSFRPDNAAPAYQALFAEVEVDY